jgi:hypothetical protein
MVWVLFAIIDMPVSLLYFLAGNWYSSWLEGLGKFSLAQFFYLPHLLHGLLGTIWWYFAPRLYTGKKYGGIWGRNKNGLKNELPSGDR